MPEPYGIETAGSFTIGASYLIVSLGNTDYTVIGSDANKVGATFTATGAGTGTGTARRLSSQLGRIGGKLLADNLTRDGIDLAFKNTIFDTPVLYLKIDPDVPLTIDAGNFFPGRRYKIRTIGTTDFTLIGAASNTVGLEFIATNVGSGTGTADQIISDASDPNPQQSPGSGIGVNNDTPLYDLDVADDISTTNTIVSNQLKISNLIITNTGTVTTLLGPIFVSPSGHDPIITFDRLITDNISFSDNTIESFDNSNIEFNASGTGEINLLSDTNLSGNLTVTGNIDIQGDLSTPNSITFGDSSINPPPNIRDTLDFNVKLDQDLNPGITQQFSLGLPTNKWGDAWIPDWTNIGNLRPSRMRVSDQQILDGIDMEIRSLQSNDDLILSPDTGILYVEELKFENSDITNLNNSTPVQFASTGAGYLRFMGDNAVLIPAGDNSTRPSSPEIGDTRWNTDEQYLECFDGSVYVVSTGGGIEVTEEIMEDLGNVYTLILG